MNVRRTWLRCVPLCLAACVAPAVVPPAAHAEAAWLVVAASDPSAAAIARKAAQLGARLDPGARRAALVVQMHDCGDPRPMFAWCTAVEPTPERARETLRRLQATVPDAFVKRCEVQRPSLLDLKLSAVDPSIADVPDDAVNWEEEDRISTAQSLPSGAVAATVRYHAKNSADDPLEGRRQRLVLFERSGRRVTLTDNCPEAGNIVADATRIAFDCVRGQAADELLHEVVIVSTSGAPLGNVKDCRSPRLESANVVSCMAETVDADGQLQLARRTTRIGRAGSEIPPNGASVIPRTSHPPDP